MARGAMVRLRRPGSRRLLRYSAGGDRFATLRRVSQGHRSCSCRHGVSGPCAAPLCGRQDAERSTAGRAGAGFETAEAASKTRQGVEQLNDRVTTPSEQMITMQAQLDKRVAD